MKDKKNCFDEIWKDKEQCCDTFTCQPSVGPINVVVDCGDCPPPNGGGNGGGDNGCCCNAGMSKALAFIKQELQDNDYIANNGLDIFGINSSALVLGATILNPDPTDINNIDIVKVQDQTDQPDEFRYVSTCAIYYIGINLDLPTGVTLASIIAKIQAAFSLQDNPDCCCKDTIARKLNELRIAGTCVSLDLNNQTGGSSDVDGGIISLDADVVWIDDDDVAPKNYDLIVTSICYIAMIKPERCSAPADPK